MFLLDVNVLIALCDEAHECRPAARETLTDLYLVTLAGYHRMRLATFDARLAKQRNVSHNDLVLIPVSR